jgi:hypothetical protein
MDNHSLKYILRILLGGSRIRNFSVQTNGDFSSVYLAKSSCHIVYFEYHYYAAYFTRDKNRRLIGEFFCSLGKNPITDYGLIVPNLYSYKYNGKKLQGDSSVLCSLFCLYFAHKKGLGFSFDKIINRFSFNTYVNDIRMCRFYKSIKKQNIKTLINFTYCP